MGAASSSSFFRDNVRSKRDSPAQLAAPAGRVAGHVDERAHHSSGLSSINEHRSTVGVHVEDLLGAAVGWQRQDLDHPEEPGILELHVLGPFEGDELGFEEGFGLLEVDGPGRVLLGDRVGDEAMITVLVVGRCDERQGTVGIERA